MSESLAKGIAKQVADAISMPLDPSIFDALELLSHRKKLNQMRKEIKSNNRAAFLGEKNSKSSRWILVWGEWAGAVGKPSTELVNRRLQDYDKLGFDFIINDREGVKDKFLYVTLTKHALERLILRSGEWLNTTDKVRGFMNGYIEPLIRFSLSMTERHADVDGSDVAEENVIIDNYFFSIVMRKGINNRGEIARSFQIKTVMPADYNGAKGTRKIDSDENVRENIFDYWPLLREEFDLELSSFK